MAVVILTLLLLVSGIWADGLPEPHHQDGKASFVLTNHHPVEATQDDGGEILRKGEEDVNKVHPTEELHQDVSEILRIHGDDVKKVQPTMKLQLSDSEVIKERAPDIVQDQATTKNSRGTVCSFPFIAVGGMCYFFSEEQISFEEAEAYCESLAHGHYSQSSLAMLDFSEKEDQALLDAVLARENTYWLGGKTEDFLTWSWIDGRNIYLQSNYWDYTEPDDQNNKCTVAAVSSYTEQRKRAYVYDQNCDNSLNFICQVGCPYEFRRIGNHCYFLSEEVGLGEVTWQNARDFCRSMAVPVGHHADLAVLGLPTQDTYHLMGSIVAGFTSQSIWLGAFAKSECDFEWVDGRSLPLTSVYWVRDRPVSCKSLDTIILFNRVDMNRTWINAYAESHTFPFICQLFTTTS